ncbi:uncharacterized protein LOC129217556 [Uloborus diversus]|uniref:uncharacterized protein LOC129217556 n=1 Tax=Uloborus diversus TaxID=327109 RepID=UPI00240A9357|nr:uncharacterized protein LOC129217556 [Uloborus diversus]
MSLDSDLPSGFQVKYLGSVSFTRKKRQPLKGIVSLQRPLLDLYTGARRRGESHRSIHPLALTQQLEICDYGLVVAEGTNRGETVITKVITPLSNVVLWAAVRFHARIIKRRVFGAAFVPLACSDGVLDPKSYVCLASKQRFLVSLTHPSVFACMYRSVARPTTFECHAFVCATAEDAVALAGLAAAAARREAERPRRRIVLGAPPRRVAPSLDSGGTSYYTPSDVTPRDEDYRSRDHLLPRTDTEEESNSYASLFQKTSSPVVGRRYRGHHKKSTHYREARALIGRPSEGRNQRREPEPLQEAPRNERGPASFRDRATMTEATEVLAETIDLSSERSSSASSSSASAGWRPLPTDPPPPLVKYTYFGYETYARPAHMKTHCPKEQSKLKTGVIQGNGTGKVTINVSYRPDSRASSASSSRTVPHGVRSFHKGGHVRNWSSLSRTSSSSSLRGATTLPPLAKGHQKVIRWSSEDALPPRARHGGFFWSLKRIGMQSLTKAKHKTGKFISTMKTKLMGTKRSSADGSEDSAYDTSEVCLSPSGRQCGTSSSPNRQTHRQQSWSFHDLRSAGLERPVVRSRNGHRRKHRRKAGRNFMRKAGRSSSSSDSGVEAAYHSDKSGSDPGRLNGVTRVQVEHGMGNGTFQRWSHTNMHEELGYIP